MRQLLLVLLAGTFGCSSQSLASEAPSAPPNEIWISTPQAEEARVSTAPVDDHEVATAIVTSGKIAFDDLQVDHVFSPVTGRVTKIEAQLGQRVKKGQALAVIDSPFERRPVNVDEQEAGAFVPITRGLDRGERVVTAGSILLSGG